MSRKHAVLWFVGPGVTFVLLVAGFLLWSSVDGSTELPVPGVAIGAIVSGLILLKTPGNRVGLLLMAAALMGSLQVVSEGYWYVNSGTFDSSIAASLTLKTTAINGTLAFSMILVFLPIIFPTGKPHAP